MREDTPIEANNSETAGQRPSCEESRSEGMDCGNIQEIDLKINDEMERTMLYLGIEEDENEQPPVADRLRSPRGTPVAARKRAASNLLLSTTPVSKRNQER